MFSKREIYILLESLATAERELYELYGVKPEEVARLYSRIDKMED